MWKTRKRKFASLSCNQIGLIPLCPRNVSESIGAGRGCTYLHEDDCAVACYEKQNPVMRIEKKVEGFVVLTT